MAWHRPAHTQSGMMNQSLLSRYRVDNVPLLIRLPFYIFGYGTGLMLFALFALCRRMVDVRISGQARLRHRPNHIFCFWHGFVALAMVSAAPSIRSVFDRAPQVWMQHPAWYMKPVHVLLRLMGVKKLILGSTGHHGRQAADRLVADLRQGFSTVMNPDGPYGPGHQVKKGVLHLSLKSGVPVVPVRFASSRCWTLPTWDRKQLPRPGAVIELEIGEPIQVTKGNFDQAHELIAHNLNGPVCTNRKRVLPDKFLSF